jgi:arylformamidase
MIIDISPPIHPGIAVWPGDVPFQANKSLRMADGSNIDLGDMRTTYHVGAHADAPNHYDAAGCDAATMDLEPFLGPCQVIHVDVGRGKRVLPKHVAEVSAPRILFSTGTFPNSEKWNEDFAALSPELIDYLHNKGVLLVGIDTPSVDLMHDKTLHTHEALARTGMRNLEGLVLDNVEPGSYMLSALPLALVDADASPVRAVLYQPEADTL